MSSTALVLADKVQDPLHYCVQMGIIIAKSQLCGCSSPEQGAIVALTCLSENITPIDFGRRYHIIQGRPSMRSDAMLAEFRMKGGKHKLVKTTPDEASLELTWEGETTRWKMTWKDAQDESWPWTGKDETGKKVADGKGELKTNWSTPMGRQDMLWARICSRAVRKVCPEIVSGVYTPEEVGDLIESEIVEEKPVVSAVEAMHLNASNGNGAGGTVVEAAVESSTVEADPSSESTSGSFAETVTEGYARTDQVDRIEGLFQQLGMSDDQQSKALNKRSVSAIAQLTVEQADEMVERLVTATRNQKVAAGN